MYGLDTDTIRSIKEVFKKHSQISKVVLYGSRAKGNYKNGSDIDITLFGDHLHLNNSIYPLMDALDELDLAYTFDISIFDQLKEQEFIDHINRVGKVFYQKEKGVPEGWEMMTLGDVVNKGSSNISLNKVKDDEGEYPLFSAKGLNKSISFFHQEKEYLAIIKDGAGIGRVSKHPAKSSVVATMQYLIPKEGFDIGFIQYFLNGIDFQKHRQGSTIPHVYFKDYKSEPFPLLSLPEQQRIVAILDKAFAAIETAKANATQNLLNAKELFESYLQNVFENKGDDWEEKRLDEITEVKDGTHDSPKYIKEGIPFVTQKNIKPDGFSIINTKFITEIDHEKFYKRSNVTYGDILISMIGANRGIAAIVDDKRIFSIKNVGLIKLSDSINMSYLLYYLKSPIAMKYVLYMSNGGAQEFVGLRALRAFPIPLPSLKEQQQIVKKLNSLSSKTKKLKVIYQQKIVDLEELKKSILNKAFKGEL